MHGPPASVRILGGRGGACSPDMPGPDEQTTVKGVYRGLYKGLL